MICFIPDLPSPLWQRVIPALQTLNIVFHYPGNHSARRVGWLATGSRQLVVLYLLAVGCWQSAAGVVGCRIQHPHMKHEQRREQTLSWLLAAKKWQRNNIKPDIYVCGKSLRQPWIWILPTYPFTHLGRSSSPANKSLSGYTVWRNHRSSKQHALRTLLSALSRSVSTSPNP